MTFAILTKALGESTISWTQVKLWYNQFKEGTENVKDHDPDGSRRHCIKFYVKNEIKCARTFEMFASLLWTEHKFNCGPGRPNTSITHENIKPVKKMILDYRRITIREVADDVGI